MDRKVPLQKYLPRICGLIPVLLMLTYSHTMDSVVNEYVPLSSTAALGYIALAVVSVVLWGAGYIVGLIMTRLYTKLGASEAVSALKLSIVTLVLATTGMAFSYHFGNEAGQVVGQRWQPRVILDTEGLVRREAANGSAMTAEQGAWPDTFDWKEEQAQLALDSDRAVNISAPFLQQPIVFKPGISYVSFVTVQPVMWHNSEYLAVLIRLRPTSRRSVLAVFNPQGQLVYEELLERCWRGEQQDLVGVSRRGNNTLMVNQCDAFTLAASDL